jgi:hypothetical protein
MALDAQALFYSSAGPPAPLPPISAHHNPLVTAKYKSQNVVDPSNEPVRLGLRYALLLIDGGHSEPVSADRVFKAGECFALTLEVNHSAYLYVLARQSSGSWKPLIPSVQAGQQIDVLAPGVQIRVPKGGCFQIVNPPGTETMFVLLTREPADALRLTEEIVKQRLAAAVQVQGVSASAQPNSSTLTFEIERFRTQYAGPAIVTTPGALHAAANIGNFATTPLSPIEVTHSVYRVTAEPGNTVTAEIQIRH